MSDIDITVPTMGESVTQATVGQIFKQTGSLVELDAEILELETDKVNQVIYAPQSGIVTFAVNEGDTVSIGASLGKITPSQVSAAPKEETQKEAPAPTTESRKGVEAFVKDVQQKEPEPVAPPAPALPEEPTGDVKVTRKPMSNIRKIIAERLVEAQHTTAMLTTFNEVDMSRVMELRAKYKDKFIEKHGVKLGFMSFFVKAAVSALEAFPEVNSYIDGTDLVTRWTYDVSIAVSTERGLFVPVVRECDKLSFAQIEQQIVNYATKAREGKLAYSDLEGGGFTITNGGVFGSLISTPILNPPQSAILGMHKIEKRPVVIEDEIVIRPMMYLAVSYDHRVIDGKEAVSFLVHIKEALENPSKLLMEI